MKETQDIAEELKIMKHIYDEQLKVMKDFGRKLTRSRERRGKGADELSYLQRLLEHMIHARDVGGNSEGDREEAEMPQHRQIHNTNQASKEMFHEAQVVLDSIYDRHAAISDLERSALQSYQQVCIAVHFREDSS